MQFHQRVFAALACVVAAFSVIGCASGPTVTPAQMAEIRAGRQSAIIMAYRTSSQLNFAIVTFQNVATRASYQVAMGGQEAWAGAGPGMVSVPPGRYRVSAGGLNDANSNGNLPLLAYWFAPFDVAPGEVVDVGTLNIEDINLHTMPGMGERVFNTLFALDPRQRDTYFVYNIDYSDEARVQSMLENTYPDLGVTPVRRPLSIVFDRERFERIIVESYTPHADGSLPTPQEASARVSAALGAMLDEGRAPKPGEPAS